MNQAILANQKGKMSAGGWILLVLLVAGIVIGGKLIPPWLDYYMMKEKLEAVVKASNVPSDTEILADVNRIVEERGIPIDVAQDIVIERDGKSISITAEWVTPVTFPGGYTKELQFTVQAER